ncbi:MAG: RsmB/NOP family class I SAM-dependent RNA methyltransferase [Anaerolineales bacterium]|nr:RsmB/NOP family class I SAM-dependent RNA methyltransferase [Anaerolineales bacterium]
MTTAQSSISNPRSPFSRYQPIIDDWDAFQEVIQRPLPTTIWTNPLKTTPEQLAALLTDAGIDHEPLPWYPGGFRLATEFKSGLRWEYLAGLYHVQEEVSMLPVLFMDLQPNDRVLDLCAAPGNKTAQIAVMLNNRGTVVANDRNPGRMRAARQTFNRLGLVNVTTTTADGANFSKHAGLFDKVLADVPCTCEGTCRKDISLLLKPVNSAKLVGVQTALLRKAVQLCKPGGRIVYSTCTFAPEENEMVVDTILRESNGGLRVVAVTPPTGFVVTPGLTEWDGKTIDPSLQHALRVWPHHNDTGGFFVAVLEKEEINAKAERSKDGENDLASFAPLHLCVEEEREPWVEIVSRRFGIDAEIFRPYTIFRVGKKKVYFVNADHQPLERPSPDAIGMHFMRTDGRYPKLTTGSATLFAPHVTRNFVEITAEQVIDFMARREFPVPAAQLIHCTGNGYVMLRFKGAWIGQGALYMDAEGENGRIESLLPKGWARELTEV